MFNTGLLFGPNGDLLLKQRKVHLWDLEIEGRVQVKESKMFRRGNRIGVVETEYGRVGMGIGYDLRFPWMSQYMVQ